MTRDETIALFEACQTAQAEILRNGEDIDAAHAAAVRVWNTWAGDLLAQKRELQRLGNWNVRIGDMDLVGQTQQTIDWLEDGHANFSGHVFNETADFRNFTFPGPASFGPVLDVTHRKRGEFILGAYFPGPDVQFSQDVLFRDAEFLGPANFCGAKFCAGGDFNRARFEDDAVFGGSVFSRPVANFDNARFAKTASFNDVRFENSSKTRHYYWFVRFEKTRFEGDVLFHDAKFGGPACFIGTQFSKRTIFDDAQFTEKANFNAAQFVGDAWFKGTKFENALFEDARFSGAAHFDGKAQFTGAAKFLQARFEGYTTFRDASFCDAAVFRGISVDRVFDLDGAHFGTLPDFHAAHFAEAPRLDNLTIPSPRKSLGVGLAWRCLKARRVLPIIRLIKKRGGPLLRPGDFTAHFRALRRLAIQGHDYDNERRFLKGEILSRRFTLDGRWSFALWLGVAYDWLSDFGSSMARPVYCGAISVVFFALLYYYLAFPGTCGGGLIQTFFEAIYLSFKNALLVISWDNDTGIGKVTACLNEAKDISFWRAFALGLIQTGQKIWSATLWFLLLLAIRNRFKIK